MKKLILVIVTVLAVALTAYGTAFGMSKLMPHTPQSTSVDTQTMPETSPVTAQETPTQPNETIANHATDTRIKSNVSMIAANLESYAANNNGSYPSTGAQTISFENEYLKDMTDPITQKPYSISSAAGDGFTKVDYRVGYICGPDASLVAATTSRQFGLVVTLTSGKPYCADNSK